MYSTSERLSHIRMMSFDRDGRARPAAWRPARTYLDALDAEQTCAFLGAGSFCAVPCRAVPVTGVWRTYVRCTLSWCKLPSFSYMWLCGLFLFYLNCYYINIVENCVLFIIIIVFNISFYNSFVLFSMEYKKMLVL